MLFSALKQETRALHHQIEDTVLARALLRPSLKTTEYLHALFIWKALLLRIVSATPPLTPGLEIESRQISNLDADINKVAPSLSLQEREAVGASTLPTSYALNSWTLSHQPDERAGILYVIRGSGLGSMVITRQIKRHPNPVISSSLNFFSWTGLRPREIWQAFMECTSERSKKWEKSQIEGAILAAKMTFQLLIEAYQNAHLLQQAVLSSELP